MHDAPPVFMVGRQQWESLYGYRWLAFLPFDGTERLGVPTRWQAVFAHEGAASRAHAERALHALAFCLFLLTLLSLLVWLSVARYCSLLFVIAHDGSFLCVIDRSCVLLFVLVR